MSSILFYECFNIFGLPSEYLRTGSVLIGNIFVELAIGFAALLATENIQAKGTRLVAFHLGQSRGVCTQSLLDGGKVLFGKVEAVEAIERSVLFGLPASAGQKSLKDQLFGKLVLHLSFSFLLVFQIIPDDTYSGMRLRSAPIFVEPDNEKEWATIAIGADLSASIGGRTNQTARATTTQLLCRSDLYQ